MASHRPRLVAPMDYFPLPLTMLRTAFHGSLMAQGSFGMSVTKGSPTKIGVQWPSSLVKLLVDQILALTFYYTRTDDRDVIPQHRRWFVVYLYILPSPYTLLLVIQY